MEPSEAVSAGGEGWRGLADQGAGGGPYFHYSTIAVSVNASVGKQETAHVFL